MHDRRLLLLLVVALALAAAGLHVCVLPGHVDAAVDAHGHDGHAAAAGHHDEAAPPSHQEPGTYHAGSCEAVRTGHVAGPTPVLVALAAAPESAGVVPGPMPHAIDTPPPTASPPLYLVHRVLLI